MDEYNYDLFWHAINYRTAILPSEAEDRWLDLEACVKRLIEEAEYKARLKSAV